MSRPVAKSVKKRAKKLLGKSKVVRVEPAPRQHALSIERQKWGAVRLVLLDLRRTAMRKGHIVFSATTYIWLPFRGEPVVAKTEVYADSRNGKSSQAPAGSVTDQIKAGWEATREKADTDDLVTLDVTLAKGKVTTRM